MWMIWGKRVQIAYHAPSLLKSVLTHYLKSRTLMTQRTNKKSPKAITPGLLALFNHYDFRNEMGATSTLPLFFIFRSEAFVRIQEILNIKFIPRTRIIHGIILHDIRIAFLVYVKNSRSGDLINVDRESASSHSRLAPSIQYPV